MTTPDTTVHALHARLRLDHIEVNDVLERLIEAYETGDQGIAREAFREFDARLSAHLAMEEELLLPEFARVDPADAQKIVDEHDAIRARIEELVIGSDLHATKLPAVRQLAADLRSHALHEEQLMYRWVDQAFADRPLPVRSTPIQPPASH